jgi:Putative lumazine-binding
MNYSEAKHRVKIKLIHMKIISLLLLLIIVNANAQQKEVNETEQIKRAVNKYIEGRNNGDIELLKSAFHSSAVLKGVDAKTKELTVLSIDEYMSRQTAGKKQTCTTEISLINHINDVAIAQVILRYPAYAYYDYLVLMKIKDEWIIAEKIYTKVVSENK